MWVNKGENMKAIFNALLIVGMMSGSVALAGSDHKHKKGEKHHAEAGKTCEKCKKSEKECTCDDDHSKDKEKQTEEKK